MAIATSHKLLTDSWTAAVATLETVVGSFEADGAATNDCQVAFFEIVRDDHLHVNVTHRYQTRTAHGWMGPARLPQGFVHNRTFGSSQPLHIIRHVREMVFASRVA